MDTKTDELFIDVYSTKHQRAQTVSYFLKNWLVGGIDKNSPNGKIIIEYKQITPPPGTRGGTTRYVLMIEKSLTQHSDQNPTDDSDGR